MRKNIILSIFSMMLAAVLLVSATLYQRYGDAERMRQMATLPPYTGHLKNTLPLPSEETTAATFADAPDVRFYDAEGEPVRLSDFQGKPVVINFWTSWANPSKAEFPALQSAYDAYKENVVFLMINVTDGNWETEQAAREYWASLKTKMPVYFDRDSDAAEGFRVTTIPSTFFINAQGKSVAYASGELTREQLERGIRMCLDKSE